MHPGAAPRRSARSACPGAAHAGVKVSEPRRRRLPVDQGHRRHVDADRDRRRRCSRTAGASRRACRAEPRPGEERRARGRPLPVDEGQAARQRRRGRPLVHRRQAAGRPDRRSPRLRRRPRWSTGFSTSTIDADIALRHDSRRRPVRERRCTTRSSLVRAQLAAERFPARVIIVVTDGNETRATATLEGRDRGRSRGRRRRLRRRRSRARSSRPAPLKELAAETGGNYYGARLERGARGRLRARSQPSSAARGGSSTQLPARPGETLTLAAHALGSSASTRRRAPGDDPVRRAARRLASCPRSSTRRSARS